MNLKKSSIRRKFENNGLLMIAIMMVAIYWVFDYLSSGHFMTRAIIAALVIVYGFFTQSLINSRKAALDEKDRVYKRLIQSEKLAAIGAVAAGVAHEVKNPLAIILQGIEFLKTALKSDERLLDVTQRIEKSVIRADNIVKGLLSYSRDISLKMEELDIASLIDESISFVEEQLRLKNIQVKKRYDANLPKIIIDSLQMKQVFTNLFTNAIEAMPQGGILGIRAEPAGDKSDQSPVRITISDTGQGIPEESLKKIFDPFYTTKHSEKNTGLGLSISKGIIDKHHGAIELQSEQGRGTRITIDLPTGMV